MLLSQELCLEQVDPTDSAQLVPVLDDLRWEQLQHIGVLTQTGGAHNVGEPMPWLLCGYLNLPFRRLTLHSAHYHANLNNRGASSIL